MHEAFFFGPPGEEVFANYHPAAGDGATLVVICPPILSEYMRTHLALRELAISLAERGQHVLRIDYRGTGDSSGELTDFTVAHWLDDVRRAVAEGQEISGAQTVRLLGVRAGGLLAMHVGRELPAVERIVLWDPVPGGAAYLEAMMSVHAGVLARHGVRPPSDPGFVGYGGYRMSPRMREGFSSLQPIAADDPAKSKVRVVSTLETPDAAFASFTTDVDRFNCRWDSDSEDLMMPQLVLERLRLRLLER